MNKQIHDQAAKLEADSLAGDFALLFEAIADAFHGLSPDARVESRWSRLRECGQSFGSRC